MTISYRLHRYDNWDAANDPRAVSVNLNNSQLKLNSSGAVQTVTVSNATFTETGVNSFTAGAPKTPACNPGLRASARSRRPEISPAR